jgi:hypothetical protein
MRRRKHYSVFLLLLALAACEPYLFDMTSDHPVSGQILTSLESVTAGSRTTTLRPRGAIQLSNFGISEYSLSFGARLHDGLGFEVLIHPRVELNRVVDSGFIARVTTHGESLTANDVVLSNKPSYSVDTGIVTAVKILTEAHLLQVIVGCDTLYRGKRYSIESDDIVIRTLDGSSLDVIAPNWAYVPGLVRR